MILSRIILLFLSSIEPDLANIHATSVDLLHAGMQNLQATSKMKWRPVCTSAGVLVARKVRWWGGGDAGQHPMLTAIPPKEEWLPAFYKGHLPVVPPLQATPAKPLLLYPMTAYGNKTAHSSDAAFLLPHAGRNRYPIVIVIVAMLQAMAWVMGGLTDYQLFKRRRTAAANGQTAGSKLEVVAQAAVNRGAGSGGASGSGTTSSPKAEDKEIISVAKNVALSSPLA